MPYNPESWLNGNEMKGGVAWDVRESRLGTSFLTSMMRTYLGTSVGDYGRRAGRKENR
jgi:hypothetical protein